MEDLRNIQHRGRVNSKQISSFGTSKKNIYSLCDKPNLKNHPGGHTDLERGYGDVRPWRPPCHTSPVIHKGPISSNSQFTSPPFEKKWEIYLNFRPNFRSQAPKFGNFQIFLVFRDASLIVAERSTNAANAVHVIRLAPVGVCGAREWDYPADK